MMEWRRTCSRVLLLVTMALLLSHVSPADLEETTTTMASVGSTSDDISLVTTAAAAAASSANLSETELNTGIPDSGRFGEVNVSEIIGVTNSAASSSPSPADSPLDPRLDPILSPALTSGPAPASSEPGNNLSPSDNVAPEQTSSPSSSPSQTSTEAVKEGGERNVNHHADHSEREGHEAGSSDDPILASSTPSPSSPATSMDPPVEPHTAPNNDQNATDFFPTIAVLPITSPPVETNISRLDDLYTTTTTGASQEANISDNITLPSTTPLSTTPSLDQQQGPHAAVMTDQNTIKFSPMLDPFTVNPVSEGNISHHDENTEGLGMEGRSNDDDILVPHEHPSSTTVAELLSPPQLSTLSPPTSSSQSTISPVEHKQVHVVPKPDQKAIKFISTFPDSLTTNPTENVSHHEDQFEGAGLEGRTNDAPVTPSFSLPPSATAAPVKQPEPHVASKVDQKAIKFVTMLSDPPTASPAIEVNVIHHGDDDASTRSGHETGDRDDGPTPAPSTPSPQPSTGSPVQPEEPQAVLNIDQNATELFPSLPVPSTTNHTASTATSNMTDDAEAKCNRESSSSFSSRYNLSGFRLGTFEAVIWIFILVFMICAVIVVLFVFTIFRRKGNHTFDFQASRDQTPTVFQMRGKFLQENRMLRGYDLNTADQILKDEESNFPLNHLNPRVQNLDSYHHYLHPHPHYTGVRRGSSGSSSSPTHRHKRSKYTTDPHPSSGISLKPIYLPRPMTNAMPATANNTNHSSSPTNDSGRLVSQSLYPYNLARLSPSERNRVFYQKRIPGGANILVNDAWMVLPLDSVRRSSCYSCSSSTREDRSTTCDGCRRHSCPVDHVPIGPLDQVVVDRDSPSSRGSRDSYTNNNNRNESNYNQMNNNEHHVYPNQRSSPAKKSNNNKCNNDTEKKATPVSSIVNDVTDTKL